MKTGAIGTNWAEIAAHRGHLQQEVEEKSAVGRALMARLYRTMDVLEEISGEARKVGDFESAVKAQVSVSKVVEVAARVSGVVAPTGPLVNVETKPLAVNFDVRKVAESYSKTALEHSPRMAEEGDAE